MTSDEMETLREKDRAVLHHIDEGHDDIQKITSGTTFENHEVNYCFQKLEDLDLIEVEKPEGMVERVVDGQKRVFEAPKQAELTEKGVEYLEQANKQDSHKYRDLSRRELVEKVHELEEKIEKLEQKFETFRRQVRDMLD